MHNGCRLHPLWPFISVGKNILEAYNTANVFVTSWLQQSRFLLVEPDIRGSMMPCTWSTKFLGSFGRPWSSVTCCIACSISCRPLFYPTLWPWTVFIHRGWNCDILIPLTGTWRRPWSHCCPALPMYNPCIDWAITQAKQLPCNSCNWHRLCFHCLPVAELLLPVGCQSLSEVSVGFHPDSTPPNPSPSPESLMPCYCCAPGARISNTCMNMACF